MPEPYVDETESDFISRCVAELIDSEGRSTDQAIAMCHSYWDGAQTQPEGETMKDIRQPTERKILPAIVTKVDEAKGIVDHTVAIFGNVDLGGDKIWPGAFSKTISERGGSVRVLDAHNTDSIMRVLGKPLELREISRAQLPAVVLERYPDATGALMASTQFLMDTPEGAGAFARIKSGAVSEYSIGYDPISVDFEAVKMPDGTEINVRNLREIRLWEYSPVIFAMNPATSTIGAKSTEADGDKSDGADVEAPAAVGTETDETGPEAPLKAEEKSDEKEPEAVDTKTDETGPEAPAAVDTKTGETGVEAPLESDETGPAAPLAVDVTAEKELTPAGPQRRLGDVLQGTIHRAFTSVTDQLYIDGYLDREQRIALSSLIGSALDVLTVGIPIEIAEIPLPSWGYEAMSSDHEPDTKAGRVLAARNQRRIAAALATLLEVLEDAGVDVSGFGGNADEDDEKSAKGRVDIDTDQPMGVVEPGTNSLTTTGSDDSELAGSIDESPTKNETAITVTELDEILQQLQRDLEALDNES